MENEQAWCTDCNARHGERYATFSEWSWHFPPYEELGKRSLGEITPDRAAGLAWRYQQATIDALTADLLRLAGPVCSHDQKRAVEHFAGTHTVPLSFEPLIPAHAHEYEECWDCDALISYHHDGVSHCVHCGELPEACDGTPFIGACRPPHPKAPEIEEWIRQWCRNRAVNQ